MNNKRYIPHPALQEFVLHISTVEVHLPEGTQAAVTPYPPTPLQSLMFYGHDPVQMRRLDTKPFTTQPSAVLIGPQYTRVNIRVMKRLRAIRVDFRPGGMYRLLGIPMPELLDKGFDAADLLGQDLLQINDQLLHTATLEEGKNIIEQYLLKKRNHLKEMLPFDLAMWSLLENSGMMTIEKIASMACLSLRQLERKCNERIGMPPKMYARIVRFSKAYRLHESHPHLSWTAIAHQAGYFDQMHMIRDFKDFAGVNPSVIEKDLSFTPLRMQKDLLL